MSVLESFYYQFSADASGLKKGLAEADKSSADLEKNLQNADDRASKLGNNLDKLAQTAGKALASLFALHELKKVTQETADHTYAVTQQARAMNVNVESLSAWQQAVKASGGTAEGATESIAGLRDKFVEMSRYGSMMGPEAFAFQQLGISAQDMKDSIKDPLIVMGKLADQFGKLDRTQALFLGKKLGLDQGSINLLMQGRRAMDELIARQKELGVVTNAQSDAAMKFELAEVKAGMAIETLKREVVSELLPAFTWLIGIVEKSIDFMHEHSGMMKTAAVIVSAALAPALWGAATAAWALVAPMLIAAAPFIALGAAILLVADDIDTFMKGGDSMLGRIVQKWPVMGDIFRGIGAAARTMQDMLLKVIDQILHPFQTFHDLIESIFNLIKSAPAGVMKFIASVTGGNYAETGAPTAQKAAEAAQKAIVKPAPIGVPKDVVDAARMSEAVYGIPAEVTMAQWKLESNSGKNMPTGSNNPFGIKARAGQPFVEAMTTENINGKDVRVMAKFAKYESLMEAFNEHAKLLSKGGAYKKARENQNDPLAFADALTGTYATDQNYGEKLKRIMAEQSGAMAIGKMQLAATQTPLNSMSSQAIANNAINTRGDTNIKIDVGGVHTQATNGREVANQLTDTWQSQINSATNFFDDGRMA